MTTVALKDFVEREPFRRFALRLKARLKNYKMIFFFGKSGNAVRIDWDSVVEIIEND